MNKKQISVNLESLQDRMDGTKQIQGTLAGLQEAGYEYVEVLHCQNPDDGSSWAQLLQESSLKASSVHELYEDIEKDPKRIAEKAKSVGCRYVACGLSRFTVWEDETSLKELTDGLNRLGSYFAEQGLMLLYHNHNMEFAKYDGCHTALDYIFSHTDPSLVGAELDAYWVQLSGASPAAWCKKLQGRLKTIHLKDLGVTGVSTPEKYIKTPAVLPLGYGNLDLPGIINAAQEAGCEWFIVETHTGWIDGDSLKTAASAYQYLSGLCE